MKTLILLSIIILHIFIGSASANSLQQEPNKKSFEDLVKEFSSSQEDVRFRSLGELAATKEPRSSQYLLQALKDENWLIRGRAAQLFPQVTEEKREEFFQKLLLLVKDTNWYVRQSVAIGIGAFLEKPSLQTKEYTKRSLPLLDILRSDTEFGVRAQASRAIAASRDEEAMLTLGSLLEDQNEHVQWTAAMALADFGTPQTKLFLKEVNKKLSPKTSRPISVALYRMGEKEAFDDLVAAISESNSFLKTRLILLLCKSQDARSAKPLGKLLLTADKEIKQEIVDALVGLKTAEAADQLLAFLKLEDKNYELRFFQLEILNAVVRIQQQSSVRELVEMLLTVREREMGEALLDAVASFKTRETIDLLFEKRKDEKGEIRPIIELALDRMGVGVDGLLKEIKGTKKVEWYNSQDSVRWLASIGTNSVLEPLVIALENIDPKVRAEAARSLAKHGDRAAIESLLPLLEDKDPVVVSTVVDALKRLGINSKSISERLQSLEWRVRADATNIAGRMRLLDVLPLVIKNTQDTEVAVRYESVNALGRMQDVQAVSTLITLLDDENSRVRSASVLALGKIGSSQAISALIRVLGGYEVALGGLAADELVKVPSRDLSQLLINQLNSRSWRARAQAARVLGYWNEVRAIEQLVNLLNDRSAPVRYYACQSLIKIGEPAVASLITQMRKEGVGHYGAAQALASIGAPAVEPLCRLTTESSGQLKISSAVVLAQIGDPRAVEPLIMALDDERFFVRDAISLALGNMGEPAYEPLLEALRSKKIPTRRAGAARALKFLGKSEAIPLLLELLSDKEVPVRVAAVDAIAGLGGKSVTETLEEIIRKDNSENVRTAARTALGKIGTQKVTPNKR